MRRLVLACFLPLLLASCNQAADNVRCDRTVISRPYFKTPVAEQTMEDIVANMVKCLPADQAEAYAENIGTGTPEAVRATLAALYRNDPPDAAALSALGADIDLLLRPKEDRFPHTNLLNEAIRQQNHAWLVALLDAGANPNASGSLMAYTAAGDIFHPGSPWHHMFQDGSPAIPFLQAYLDHGGDVNTTGGGGYNNSALINSTFNNMAARIFLLENGADGWLTGGPIDWLSFDLSIFGSRARGSLAADYNEETYILLQRNLFRMPTEPLFVPMVQDQYLRSLEEMSGAMGPTARHELWTLQKVIGAMIAKGHLTPSPRMAELLRDDPVPDAEGGWILPAGQLHQAFDDPRVGSVLGTEIW